MKYRMLAMLVLMTVCLPWLCVGLWTRPLVIEWPDKAMWVVLAVNMWVDIAVWTVRAWRPQKKSICESCQARAV